RYSDSSSDFPAATYPPFPYTTLFRSCEAGNIVGDEQSCCLVTPKNPPPLRRGESQLVRLNSSPHSHLHFTAARSKKTACATLEPDRKSTRLNSSHGSISYAVFCLKKK